MNGRICRLVTVFLFICVSAPAAVIPADRLTVWNPGLNSAGGIPERTMIFRILTPSGGDDTAAIQDAVDQCPEGQVILLGPGDFRISGDGIEMNRSRITLRGSGPDRTRLLKDPEVNWMPVICLGNRWSGDKYMSNTLDLASDGVKGAYSVTLADVPEPPLAAGELVLIDQVTDPDITVWSPDSPPGHDSRSWFCRTDRPVSQVMEVASADGPDVTFTTPLHINFLIANRAQLARYGEDWMGPDPRPSIVWSGIEDLYLEKGTNGNIVLENCAYCWVKNVESSHSEGSSIDLVSCFRCEVRDSYIHTSDNPNPGGGGYLLDLSRGSADNLVENNAIWNANKVMVMRASGGGNVIGYNYFEDGWIEYQPGWVESGATASHMTTAHYELFEGNQAFNFDGESTWGNAVYITVLRNHFTGKRRSVPPLGLTDEGFPRAVSLNYGHWWYSFIGNVLGTGDMDPSPYPGYTLESVYPWNEDLVPMWALGVGYDWGPADPQVMATVIRHGNFDYVTQAVTWEPGIEDRDIPVSLYLEEKPEFFGSSEWPWVEPDAGVRLHTLPARERFDAIHGFTSVRISGSADTNRDRFLDAAPNPFNSRVVIRYEIPPGADKVRVRLSVFRIDGRLAADLEDGIRFPGHYTAAWDAMNFPCGMYIVKLRSGSAVMARKVLHIK